MQEIIRPEVFQQKRAGVRRKGKTLGFVPTMGALHEGHLSLIRQAARENNQVAVSIFVNPLQFGPREDFSKYPRVLNQDRRLLEKAGVDFLFCPAPGDLYPEAFSTIVEPAPELLQTLCAVFRPGHFRGVTTVVAKLLNIVAPDKVYFGQKDYQQAAILKKMISDLNFSCKFCLVPTVREKDGLALSSRNIYLTPEQRLRAVAIPQTLFWVRAKVLSGEKNLGKLNKGAVRLLRDAVDRVQYFEIVDPENLSVLARPCPGMLAATACFVGETRLIDNVIISPSKTGRG